MQVIIITNSDDGWVKYSAERYLPGLLPILKNYRIVSARTRYEKFYPNQPLCWKAAAFAHEANEHFCGVEESALLDSCSKLSSDLPDMDVVSTDDSSMGEGSISSHEESPGFNSQDSCPVYRREIVSFGDSMEERTAVKIVSDQLSSTPKSVMFLSNPTPTQIIGQLTMLTHHMGFVCKNSCDLDLEISQKQAEKCAAGYLSKNREPTPVKENPSILQRLLRAGSACVHEDEMEHYGC